MSTKTGQLHKLINMYVSTHDVLAGQTLAERRATLESISAAEFLRRLWDANDEILNCLKSRTLSLWGFGLDFVPASRTLDSLPGFVAQRAALRQTDSAEPYTYHFPDGNATIARLLVRGLVPGVTNVRDPHDITLAAFDYNKLDHAGARCRIRLQSTATEVRNTRSGVEVTYVQQGKVRRAAAAHCVLACYHSMIPYIFPDLQKAQREALARNVKMPLVYVNLAARNWKPWQRAGVAWIENPGGVFWMAALDFPVTMPGYPFSADPSKPICIHLEYEPTVPPAGLDCRSQYRAGRAILYAQTFDQLEGDMRDELRRMLGSDGFEFDRDIAAITINRWPHGYYWQPNPLEQSPFAEDQTKELARRPVGQIAIANADAAYSRLAAPR